MEENRQKDDEAKTNDDADFMSNVDDWDDLFGINRISESNNHQDILMFPLLDEEVTVSTSLENYEQEMEHPLRDEQVTVSTGMENDEQEMEHPLTDEEVTVLTGLENDEVEYPLTDSPDDPDSDLYSNQNDDSEQIGNNSMIDNETKLREVLRAWNLEIMANKLIGIKYFISFFSSYLFI